MNGLRKTLGCLLLLLLAAVTSVYAQSTKVYSGTVADADSNDPIIGVNITLKGTSTGTITDASGKFSINAPIGATLELSYIGYVTQTIKAGSQKSVSITLLEDTEQLEEVVVV